MTVTTEQSAIIFHDIIAGTALNLPFPVQATTEITVRYGEADTAAELGTDFSVTLAAPDYLTAQVTPTASLVALAGTGGTISVRRELPLTQPTAIPTLATLATGRIEQMFDRRVMAEQQLQTEVDYRLAFPTTDPASSIDNIPGVDERIGQFAIYDSLGRPAVAQAVITGENPTPITDLGVSLVTAQTAADVLALLGIDLAATVAAAVLAATPTGVIHSYLGGDVPAGYILGWGSIGNAGSGATNTASAAMLALYTKCWNGIANAQAAVSGGRGGSALEDFNALKTLTLPALAGRTLIGRDDMSGAPAGIVTLAGSGIDGTKSGIVGGVQNGNVATPVTGAAPAAGLTATAGAASATVSTLQGGGADSAPASGVHVHVITMGGSAAVTATGNANVIRMQPSTVVNYIVKT